jgi:PAS domain S-box-containing protein
MIDTALQSNTDRRQLQQIIAGLTEGVILVEPDQTILWANEAALTMHGVEKVGDLGRDVTQYRERFQLRYRNNHALEDGRYPIERVISGEKFTDVLVEVFLATDHSVSWVHRVRSLVLTDADGDPDVLVLILHDASEWADAERRFERTFNANPAPAIICRLSDQRYIKVNLGFLDMTGYASDDLLGRTVYEFDVFEQAQQRDVAIERLRQGRTIPQMEAELRLPESRKPVIVAGQPIDIGEEACMLFTFVDLEPRRRAEVSLRQSEDRFQKTFRMLPVPSALLRADDLRVLDVNDAFCVATGCRADDLTGPPSSDTSFWLGPFLKLLEQQLSRRVSIRDVDLKIEFRDRDTIDCLVSAERVSLDGQACVLLTWLDITERKRSEMELVDAIESVLQDTSWFSRSLVEKLANVKRKSGDHAGKVELDHLTQREQQVLDAICQGDSDKEIAQRLGVALGTVRNHVAKIYAKLGVHSRNAALLWARDRGHFAASKRSGGTHRD